jgi:hypothetical protein
MAEAVGRAWRRRALRLPLQVVFAPECRVLLAETATLTPERSALLARQRATPRAGPKRMGCV